MSYSAIAVANFFIDKSLSTNAPITNMKIQKMVFFAHAVYFHERHQPLISDPVTAMQHGPVIISLYAHLKRYGSSNIKKKIEIAQESNDLFFPWETVIPCIRKDDADTRAYLDRVWSKLSPLEAWQLRAVSHMKGGAWYKTVSEFGIDPNNPDAIAHLPRNLTILDNVIEECGK